MRHIISFAIVVAFVGLVAANPIQPLRIVHSGSSQDVRKARVKLIAAEETGLDPVIGYLTLTETSNGVYIKGKLIGLEKGLHGFHVHQKGDLGNNCKNAGGHFNPHEKTHGNPQLEERHVGDLGNIETPDSSESPFTVVNVLDKVITLDPNAPNGITGLAFVVHAGEDDLGQGGDDGSLKTGNAGARLSCGIVEALNY